MQSNRFSRPFSSSLHSILSILNSISSGEAYCIQILSSISSNCHSYSFFVKPTIKHSNSSIVSAAKRVRNARIKFIILSINCTILSFKFVNCYMGLYVWETILSETLTKMNANRRNWICCLVLSYCDRRIWIAIDENGCQSTKLNDYVSKLIDQRRDWNKHSHFPECPGRNWTHIF